jgi:hypothetical protein
MPSSIDLSPICPPASATPQAKLEWLLGSRSRAESQLRNGDAYKTIDQMIDIIAGRIMADLKKTRSKKKSNISINQIKRQVREVIALLTQRIKPRWNYGTSNANWEDHADIMTKRIKSWFSTNMFDRKLKECLQWAVCGVGYLLPGWSRPIAGFMDTDLEVEVGGPDDVLMDQGRSIQTAYATHIRKVLNLSEAISRMPLSRNYLKPTRTRVSSRAQDTRKASSWLSPLLNAIGFSRTGGGDAGDTVNSFGFLGTDIEVYHTYVLDPMINLTQAPIHSDTLTYDMMTGAKTASTPWEYEVPYLGQVLELDQVGHTKIARVEDCYLYPTRRLLIWTEDHLVYDGPSWWWHGRVPAIPISMDKWPWEQVGYAMATDNISIQDAVNQLLRGVVDMFNLKMDPTLLVNGREIAKEEMDKLDLREPGGRIQRSGMIPGKDVVAPLMESYEIPQQAPEMVQLLMGVSNHLVGVADVTSLMELQQAPSADSTERLLQAQGPLATDYARELEQAITEFGYMAGWNFLEFDNTKKRLQILGQDGLSYTDYDYDFGKLLPVDVPGLPIGASPLQRALVYGRQFSFLVVPNSIFEFTDTQDKLFKFQLWRDGRFPIDPETLAEAWNLGNFGKIPGKTILEKWAWFMEKSTEHQAQVMAKAQVMAQQIQLQAQLEMMQENPQMALLMGMLSQGGGGGQGQQGTPPNGNGSGPGRKPTGQNSPSLQSKMTVNQMDRGPTVAES